MTVPNPYAETVVPRAAVRFPLRLPAPEGFLPEQLDTWPGVVGRLEYVDGELWFMPPSGDQQQETVADVVSVLATWRRQHRDFVLGTNEAGMMLGGAVRAADVAVWRKADAGEVTGGLRRTAPVLAVEVAGIDDPLDLLRGKAQWYLQHGCAVVWLVVPGERAVVVVTGEGEASYSVGEALPNHPALPDLAPRVDELFQQLDER